MTFSLDTDKGGTLRSGCCGLKRLGAGVSVAALAIGTGVFGCTIP